MDVLLTMNNVSLRYMSFRYRILGLRYHQLACMSPCECDEIPRCIHLKRCHYICRRILEPAIATLPMVMHVPTHPEATPSSIPSSTTPTWSAISKVDRATIPTNPPSLSAVRARSIREFGYLQPGNPVRDGSSSIHSVSALLMDEHRARGQFSSLDQDDEHMQQLVDLLDQSQSWDSRLQENTDVDLLEVQQPRGLEMPTRSKRRRLNDDIKISDRGLYRKVSPPHAREDRDRTQLVSSPLKRRQAQGCECPHSSCTLICNIES